MKKIGLALSGGGFRATLYHLGLVRFLRDSGILPQVTHITSVSGGSIMAAHLALNWSQYNGSMSDFDQAAAQLLAFVRMNVRNRIVRRFPLGLLLRWPRRLLGLSNRHLTRTGWLENQYKTLLFGDKSLFELPEWPQLHILTTNLSEGCLCSFNRDGLWMVKQKASGSEIDRLRVGLATVAMAVTASSAFPGFFPPLELTGRDVMPAAASARAAGVHGRRRLRQPWRPHVPLVDAAARRRTRARRRPGQRRRQANRGANRAARRVDSRRLALQRHPHGPRFGSSESEKNFQDTFGFVFARITEVVGPHEDATALHPEVQRQAANIWTDFDAFSPLEIVPPSFAMVIASAGRHVGRARICSGRTCRTTRPNPFFHGQHSQKLPPMRLDKSNRATPLHPSETLQVSGSRRIWSNLINLRDWTSHIYLPLVVLLLLGSAISNVRILPEFPAESLASSNPFRMAVPISTS